ncbi:hypothetical protein FCK90_13900 [Kocuria coralli]|uniref:Uncharacterized protein n=1 Tax=Kocuria coralli TaxID=1461025 RepID=A0A5J5KUA4_9MICC|nr:hypothetical protein [Kocuria coralli]KAA9393112.1 hypothetical protein FCK90_13900 [Kocuria coralli]
MAKRSSTNTTPRDNASLAGLFSMDFFPAEGGLGDKVNEFRTAQRIVEHSGITVMVDAWRSEDRAARKLGPTTWLSEVQVITLMLVLILSRRSALFTEMRRLLRKASTESLAVLDITVPRASATARSIIAPTTRTDVSCASWTPSRDGSTRL